MAITLKDYLHRKRVPLMVYLELTHRCSFLCVHCYIPETLRQPPLAKRREPLGLTTAEIKTVLDDLAASETLFLVFTGGEIFLRPDLEEISRYACERHFAVKYYTNGFHITPRWADLMREMGIYGLDVSVYGASEETYQRITKVRGGYERVIAGLNYLRERQIRFTMKTPVMKENFRDIPQIQALAQSYGADFRYDMVLIPGFDGDQTPFAQRLSQTELREFLASMQANFPVQPRANFEPHACAVGKWSAVISPQGEVYPCIELRQSLGNVRQRSFRDIWSENPRLKAIRQTLAGMEVDPAVFGDGLCGHCPAHSLYATGDMTKPSPEYQRVAAAKREFIR